LTVEILRLTDRGEYGSRTVFSGNTTLLPDLSISLAELFEYSE
jgi:hypothetical protein